MDVEPIVAHGARMSWTGILRPGDQFPRVVSSRLGVIVSESGPALGRHFGSWSERYRRFTSTLSSPRIEVRVLEPGEKPYGGIACVVHWVSREDLYRTGEGSVCGGDGWPVHLWETFVEEIPELPERTIAEKLSRFLDSREGEDEPEVSEWRRAVNARRRVEPGSPSGRGWLPVPAKLVAKGGSSSCIFSWSPVSNLYSSLSEALGSPEAKLRRPDPASQARYYAECVLAKLHGVSFEDPGDFLEDDGYASRSTVREVLQRLSGLETERVADRSLGPLSRFDRQ